MSDDIEIFIDDTPSDFSSALSFETEEEYEKYRKCRKEEIDEEIRQMSINQSKNFWRILPDPDFKDFDGTFAGGINIEPPTETYNYTKMIQYMKENNKEFIDLTIEEINKFRTN